MADIKLTITIPDSKVTDFINGFNKVIKKPPQHQHLTDKQFFKQWLEDVLKMHYSEGKKLIAMETTPPEIDTDIVTVT